MRRSELTRSSAAGRATGPTNPGSPTRSTHRTPCRCSPPPCPEPVGSAVTVTGTADADVATRVYTAAAAAGLPAQRSAKLAAAVDEVANAGTRNSGAAVDIRLWQDRSSLVCEVRDHGTIEDLLVGRGPALSTQSRDRGIRLANELCDLVQVRSNSAGTAVRMHSWL